MSEVEARSILPRTWLDLVDQGCQRLRSEGASRKKARAAFGELVDLATTVYDVPSAEARDHVEQLAQRHFPWVPADELEPPTPAELLANEPRNVVRLRTGFETLDRSTRCGVPVGIVVTLLGAPHAGKTAVASQIAIRAASDGWRVAILFKDEGRFAGSVRIGQQLGLDREKLENQDPAELERFREALTERDIRLPDGDSERWSLEALIEWLEKSDPGRQRLLVVDSIQSAYARCAEGAKTLREAIEAKMRLLEKAAKHGMLVIVTSEMNRSAYRHKDEKENVRGIAAGAESRAIEYVSRLIVSLEGDAERIVTAKIEKNSPGGKCSIFRLRFDSDKAAFREIGEDEAESVAEEAQRLEEERRGARIRDRIRRALHQHLELNARGLERAVRGSKELLAEVRDEMVEEGNLVFRPERSSKFYRLPDEESRRGETQ